jgi:hypothetical protein
VIIRERTLSTIDGVDVRERDRRITATCQLTRAALIGIIRNHTNIIWTAYPLEKWSKDDLIAEVLTLRGLR